VQSAARTGPSRIPTVTAQRSPLRAFAVSVVSSAALLLGWYVLHDHLTGCHRTHGAYACTVSTHGR
jgi:hypothetical protein